MSQHRVSALDPLHTVDVGFSNGRYFAHVTTATDETIARFDAATIFELRSNLAPYATMTKEVLRDIYNPPNRSGLETDPRALSDRPTEAKVDVGDQLADLVEKVITATRLAPAATKSLLDELANGSFFADPDFHRIVVAAQEAFDQTMSEMQTLADAKKVMGSRDLLVATLASVDWHALAAAPREELLEHKQAIHAFVAIAQGAQEDFIATRRAIQFFVQNDGLVPITRLHM